MQIPEKKELSGYIEGLSTANMDHHGLVGAVCKDLKIAQRIDKKLGVNPTRKVSPGQCVVAMILNGLGYTNRTLYMSDHFFASKPIEHLIGPEVQAKDITDYTLAHALDDIAKYGSSKLFMELGMEIAIENNLLEPVNHLDTTTFSLEGEYETKQEDQVIRVSHGHSKDHRPDLKQVVLSLVVNGSSGIPICMEPLSGNSSDKVSFHETIKKVEAFKKEINIEESFKWVADSALYTKDKLLKTNTYTWLTRVPETIKQAKELLEKPEGSINWDHQSKGYKTSSYNSNYGGSKQRWLLVYSEQSYQREEKTLARKLIRQEESLQQSLWHLSNQIYVCQTDAKRAVEAISSKHILLEIKYEIEEIKGYLRAGKPKKGEKKEIKGYKLVASFEKKQKEISQLLSRKGRFILATNELDTKVYKDESILEDYKSQQKVERGFRFLKDPWFMVSSVYLKLPRRIESLMMVMSLTLLVYTVGQYKLRKN